MTSSSHDPQIATIAVSRQDGLERQAAPAADALFVDTYHEVATQVTQFRFLDPLFFWPDPVIPVPGRERMMSHSVEAVWQGLKLIDGFIDLDQTQLKPYKRPSDQWRTANPTYDYPGTKFLHGRETIGLLEARLFIYVPTYLFLLNSLVPVETLDLIAGSIRAGVKVVFFDWDSNFDLFNPNSSFSHSALLRDWFGGCVETTIIRSAHDHLSNKQFDAFRETCDPLLSRYRDFHGRSR